MATNTELYEQDLYSWCLTTAALLRDGKGPDVDLAAVAEELESMGRSHARELGSRLEVLGMHLLKWRFQPDRREDSHSWYDTILEQRGQLQALLVESPSLRPQVPSLLTACYSRARQRAIGETSLTAAAFPDICPWTADQVLDDVFWPSA